MSKGAKNKVFLYKSCGKLALLVQLEIKPCGLGSRTGDMKAMAIRVVFLLLMEPISDRKLTEFVRYVRIVTLWVSDARQYTKNSYKDFTQVLR